MLQATLKTNSRKLVGLAKRVDKRELTSAQNKLFPAAPMGQHDVAKTKKT